jgi:hypothetical protein
VQSACRDHAVDALPNGHCFITAAGDLGTDHANFTLCGYGDNSDVRAKHAYLSHAADTHDSGIVSITMPFFGEHAHRTCTGTQHNRLLKLFGL